MFDVMLTPHRIFDGVRVPVFAADEALERSHVAAAVFTATRHRHRDGA
jgi:hypothetical protein